MNGWTEVNGLLREKILCYNKAEVLCVTETHLKGDAELNVSEYDWIGSNLEIKHVNRCGSGGIGFLLKSSLKEQFKIEKCIEIYDNVLGIKLTNKSDTDAYMLLVCVYLPPGNYV